MRLNPYHPESYLSHLGRALFHLGRDEEAREIFARVTQPREREIAYRLAIAGRLGLGEEIDREAAELRSTAPEFEPEVFVAGQPFQLEADRSALLVALRDALAR